MSVNRGRPEVIGARSEREIDPSLTSADDLDVNAGLRTSEDDEGSNARSHPAFVMGDHVMTV